MRKLPRALNEREKSVLRQLVRVAFEVAHDAMIEAERQALDLLEEQMREMKGAQ